MIEKITRMKYTTLPFLLGMLLIIGSGCVSTEEPTTLLEDTFSQILEHTENQQEETQAPVYVTIAGHIEDNVALTDCSYYTPKRQQLLTFAEFMAEYDLPWNLQASYEWFEGAKNCETAELMASTDGMNLMNYLHEELNVEIDVHQEGASEDDVSSGNNLADIRKLAGEVTPYVTETTGFQWDNQDQFERLDNGEPGRIFNDFIWHPELLVGGVSMKHTNGNFSDDMDAIGVWIPEGFNQEEFFRHDRSGEGMIYIGSGPNQHMADWNDKANCHFKSSADFVEVIHDYIEIGKFDAESIYTYTFFIPQKVMFDVAEHEKVAAFIEQLESLRESSDVIYQHFTQVANIWETAYNSEPNIVPYNMIHPDDYTCQRPE